MKTLKNLRETKAHTHYDPNGGLTSHTIEAHGVKGMKSTPWRKTFKHAEHLNDWVAKNDSVEVHATRDLEPRPAMKEGRENEYRAHSDLSSTSGGSRAPGHYLMKHGVPLHKTPHATAAHALTHYNSLSNKTGVKIVKEDAINEVSFEEHMSKHAHKINALAKRLEVLHSSDKHEELKRVIKKAPTDHLAALHHYNMGYSGPSQHPVTKAIEDHLHGLDEDFNYNQSRHHTHAMELDQYGNPQHLIGWHPGVAQRQAGAAEEYFHMDHNMKSTSLGHDFNAAKGAFLDRVAGTAVHEEVEQIEEASAAAKVKKALEPHMNIDQVGRTPEGHIVLRNGFFYRHGRTSEKMAADVSQHLTAAGVKHHIITHGEHNAPFRGGGSTKVNSHHYVHVKVLDEEVAMAAGAAGDPGHVQNATDNYASQKKSLKVLRRKKV